MRPGGSFFNGMEFLRRLHWDRGLWDLQPDSLRMMPLVVAWAASLQLNDFETAYVGLTVVGGELSCSSACEEAAIVLLHDWGSVDQELEVVAFSLQAPSDQTARTLQSHSQHLASLRGLHTRIMWVPEPSPTGDLPSAFVS
jgi:hypothetical protein